MRRSERGDRDVPPVTRAGYAALVGLPNTGKSTLVNRLLERELGIVTPKPQTTRRRLLGIHTDERHQVVFVDTPGLLEPRYLLQESMKLEARRGLEEADLVLYVADAGYGPSLEHAGAFRPPKDRPALLVLNKMDRVPEGGASRLLERMEPRTADGWDGIFLTVATRGTGVRALREAVLERLPPSPFYFPPDQLAQAPERHFVEEFVREACLLELSEEVPYSVAVRVEEFREERDPLYVSATLYVERSSQKGIVIGRGGRTLRRIGRRARLRSEAFLGRRLFLDLWVKVLPGWRRKRPELKRLGFPLPRDAAGRR